MLYLFQSIYLDPITYLTGKMKRLSTAYQASARSDNLCLYSKQKQKKSGDLAEESTAVITAV